MAKQYDAITPEHNSFIQRQKMFFVGTGADEGRINISPKGTDSFRIIDSNKIVWHNLTGSGNETAAHLLKQNRMTIMFCSFEEKPLILRLYGTAKIYHPRDHEYQEHIDLFPKHGGSRQIIVMDVDLVQDSCGYAVPFMDFKEERNKLNTYSGDKGSQQLKRYWEKKNQLSIDQFETKIIED